MDKKITTAIEKLSYAVRVLFWEVAKKERLTPAQIQFLLYLDTHTNKFCKVSQLAKEFGITKATASDVIKSLKKKGLVCKRVLQEDRRISILDLTATGRKRIKKISNWSSSIQAHLKRFPSKAKQNAMLFLMELIDFLHKDGIISVGRMCITCDNFQRDIHPYSRRPHHCSLRDRAIDNSELNIDCQSHRQKMDYAL